MRHERYGRIDRLKAVEREYRVLVVAIGHRNAPAFEGRSVLPAGTSPRDIKAAQDHLETTYLIRLWAEFETALRSFDGWKTNDLDPRIRAIDLVNTVLASRRGLALSLAFRDLIHEVRNYRNTLVHDRDENALPVTLADARSRLVRFLAVKLPERWG